MKKNIFIFTMIISVLLTLFAGCKRRDSLGTDSVDKNEIQTEKPVENDDIQTDESIENKDLDDEQTSTETDE